MPVSTPTLRTPDSNLTVPFDISFEGILSRFDIVVPPHYVTGNETNTSTAFRALSRAMSENKRVVFYHYPGSPFAKRVSSA